MSAGESTPSDRGHALPRWVWGLLAAVLLVVSVNEAWGLLEVYLHHERLPRSDMAQNGGQAVQLADDLHDQRPLRFLAHLNEHNKWPFGYSLLLVPSLLIHGPSFAAATAAQTFFFALTPLALLLLARRLEPGPVGLWAAALSSAVWLTGPEIRLFSILVMREIPGAFFTLLAIAAYASAVRVGSLASWRRAAVAALILFFIKYNYGLAWIAAAGLAEWLRQPREVQRQWFSSFARALWPWPWPRRWPDPQASWRSTAIALSAYAVVLVTLTGRNPGTLIYGILVLATGAIAWCWVPRRERVHAWIRALPANARAGLEVLAAPLWVWCLSPSPIHPRDIFEFLNNRDSDLAFGNSLLFYPQSFARDFLGSPGSPILSTLLGVGLLAAVLGVFRVRSRYQPLALYCLVMAALAMLHPYKEPRFLFTLVPALVLLSSLGLGWIVFLAGPRFPGRTVAGHLLLAAATLGASLPLLESRAPLNEDLLRRYSRHSADPALGAFLDDLPGMLGGATRVGFLGTFDELSPWLLAWTSYAESDSPDLVVPRGLPAAPSGSSPAQLRGHLNGWAQKRGVDTLVVIRTDESSVWASNVDYLNHNAWQAEVIEALADDGLWTQISQRAYEDLDLRVAVFRPSESSR